MFKTGADGIAPHQNLKMSNGENKDCGNTIYQRPTPTRTRTLRQKPIFMSTNSVVHNIHSSGAAGPEQ